MDDFSAKPGVPNIYGLVGNTANAIMPGKRMLSSMTPTIVLKDGKPCLIVGSPGGSHIITTVLQTVLNMIEFRMNVQEAVDAPRFHHQWLPDKITFEHRAFQTDVLERLSSLGHRLDETGSIIGTVNAIFFDEKHGLLLGASDPRGYGEAVGY
jgi:gamma-glutamyltranspeptidase/glutathione hydrolase